MERSPTIERRDVPRRAQVAVFGAAALLYLWTFSVESDGVVLGNDVVPYALALVRGSSAELWNPHHLAFHPLAALVARALALGGAPGIEQALRAQQVVSALGGALACLLVFRWSASLAGPLLGAWLTALFGLSAGTWLYASVGETYLPATAAVAGLLTSLGHARLAGEPARALPAAGWLLAAVLLRQDSVLVLPAVWILAGARTGLVATAVAGAGALGASAAAWGLAGTGEGFLDWLRGLERTGLWGGGVDGADLVLSLQLVGLALLFVKLAPVNLVFVQAAWLIAGAGLFPPRAPGAAGWRVLAALAVHAVTRTAFFAWWQPGNLEFHAGTLLPLALAAGLLLHPRPRLSSRIVRTLPQLASLALIVSGNARILIAPNRASDVHARSVRMLEWAGSGKPAEEAGLVVALDRLQFYALQRVPPAERGSVAILDASDAAAAPGAADVAAVRAAIDRHLAAGRPVVAMRDTVLVERLGLPPWPIDGYEAIAAGLGRMRVEDERGQPWADLLRREKGP